MSRSVPFDLINQLFRPVWEAKYRGGRYRATPRDLKEAREFLMLNDDIFEGDGMIEFQEHAQEYLRSNWDGWKSLQHPCWAFLRNYNTYAPKRTIETKSVIMIACPDCGTTHKATEQCPKCYA